MSWSKVVIGLAGLVSLMCVGAPNRGAAAAAEGGEIKFAVHKIGTYRGEACCIGDFNKDGKLDIAAGPFLYLAPEFKPLKIREVQGKVDEKGKGYTWDFMNEALDVDGDGWLDIVSCDWFLKQSMWYRNPGAKGGMWEEVLIEKNGNFETGDMLDINGDGKEEEILPHVQRTVWYEHARGADGKGGFVRHLVSEKVMPFGGGAGDLNGDGRPDIIRPTAWFEAPKDLNNGTWIEHPILLGDRDPGKADHTAQVLVHDVNGDGLNDIICSNAHKYGIFWYEQAREGKEIRFKQHLIDDSWTQAHSLTLADLDGDGEKELITGKRFMAHNGSDPEESAPAGVYYYKLKRGAKPEWTRHTISFKEGIGAGMNIPVADIDGDGDLDILVTGKWGGPAWFENKSR